MEPLLLTFVYWLALNALLGRTGNVIRIESWEGSLEGLGSVPLLVAVLLVVPLVVVVVPLVVPLVVMTVPLVVVTAGAAPLLLSLLQLVVSSFDLVILTCASFVV